jgi:CYTH domain-containing protein
MKEIERKFLLKKIPKDIEIVKSFEIEQFYICRAEDVIVRVRKYENFYNIGLKKGSGVVRLEKEIEISKQDFENLKQFAPANKIRKIRHIVEYGKFIIEIDEFLDNLQGLFYAEVEFSSQSEAEKFIPPEWFGKDVSNDKRYTNAYLSETQKLPE